MPLSLRKLMKEQKNYCIIKHSCKVEDSIQKYFRFRFISRGVEANKLTQLTVKTLQWCHPGIHITVIDANDNPQLKAEDFPEINLIHIIPDDDVIAQRVGRGSRKHLFYWRHSPMVLSAIPADTEFVAYVDSDIVFMRPMDLSTLTELLRKGRIAVAVDESLVTYTNLIQERTNAIASILSIPGACGPLLQGGLIFYSTNDNGNFFEEFWHLAKIAAKENILNLLPFDDMTLLTSLLTKGGKFWDRWLPLSTEWNFITAAGQDPGVFAVGAHFGGYRAKNFLLENIEQFKISYSAEFAWGSRASNFKNDKWHFHRGIIPGIFKNKHILFHLDSPFALSWVCSGENQSFNFEFQVMQGVLENIFIYVDGKFHSQFNIKSYGKTNHNLNVEGGCVITLITASNANSDITKVKLRFNL